MTKSIKMLSVALMTLVLSTSGYAATPEERLAACDRAYEDKKAALSLCDLGVKLRDDEMARLRIENRELLNRGTRWYNNPLVWGALGAIVGVYAGARATR